MAKHRMRPRRWSMSAIAALLLAFAALTPTHAPAEANASIRFDDPGQAAAAFFLLETHLNPQATLDEMRGWYAERVSYYGRGVQDRAIILTDKKYYVARWPERELLPDMATLEIETLGDGAYALAIEVDFAVSNDETTINGRTRVELTVRRNGDVFTITRESGRILSRRRPEER